VAILRGSQELAPQDYGSPSLDAPRNFFIIPVNAMFTTFVRARFTNVFDATARFQ
jgi:hypothetical protein